MVQIHKVILHSQMCDEVKSCLILCAMQMGNIGKFSEKQSLFLTDGVKNGQRYEYESVMTLLDFSMTVHRSI